MTTITITTPELRDITRALSSDWGPALHATARRAGQLYALIWALYSLAADRWQQLTAWVERHQLHGLARLGLGTEPAVQAVIVQRQAAAVLPANIAPPADYPRLVHISDPMARAVYLVRVEQRSQRMAASLCGVSRSSLQRALRG